MYYITSIEERKAKESGNPYMSIELMDNQGVKRNFFPARELDLNKVPKNLISVFPTKMIPVYIGFNFTLGQERQRDFAVASISEVDED